VIGSWKVAAAAAAALSAAGLIAGAAYIAHVDTSQIARLAVREMSQNGYRYQEIASVLPSTDEGSDAAQTLYGYYGDLDEAGKKTSVSKETYRIRFSKFSPAVAGDISGLVPHEGKKVQRTWRVQGFARDPELVLNILAIASPEDPKPPTGIGTYYLARTGSGDFTGTAIYLDCVHKIVQCPYALASEDLSPEKARARWPELFKRSCAKIDLTPGDQGAPFTC
jgi:hypothetical protein